MMENSKKKLSLFMELYRYYCRGIALSLCGRISNPESIVAACLVAEEGSYMRDYLQDETGKICMINFDYVSE